MRENETERERESERQRECDREGFGQQTSVGSIEAKDGAMRCIISDLVLCRRRGLNLPKDRRGGERYLHRTIGIRNKEVMKI